MLKSFKTALNKRPAPFSLRLTFDERARLEEEAAGMSLSAFIKWRLFDHDKPAPKKRNKVPVKDHKAIAAVLAKIGQSRLAANINQLAKAVHTGSLPVNTETEAALQKAADDINAMREMLITALGLQE